MPHLESKILDTSYFQIIYYPSLFVQFFLLQVTKARKVFALNTAFIIIRKEKIENAKVITFYFKKL